jgi:hypothetical protein
MDPAQLTRLKNAIETAKGKITKEWRPKEYEAKIIELQEKLAALTPEVAY